MNRKVKELLKETVLRPLVFMRRKRDNYLRVNNPQEWWSVMHARATGKPLNFKHPANLNEKIQYMSFYTDTSEWSRLTDKIAVREYVKECGFEHILCNLYGTYKKSAEIDYSSLPNQFVLKTNNGCATNILVRDKSHLNISETNKKLDDWLNKDYGVLTCQPHYSRIPAMILAEQLLVDNAHPGEALKDYKFYCINGLPLYVYVYADRKDNSHDMKRMVYDMDWVEHPEYLGRKAKPFHGAQQPVSFKQMKEIAKKLSSPFKFVRVDFYEIDGKPFFGELTFTPGLQESSISFLEEMGAMIDLDNVVK